MKCLILKGNEDVVLEDVEAPGVPEDGEVLVQVRAITLNHLDVYSYRGMAFAQRTLPIVPGAEGVGQVVHLGARVDRKWENRRVAVFPAYVCGQCESCLERKENLCTGHDGILGFGRDGLAREYARVPENALVEIPDDLPWEQAACAPITFSTVVHMLCDNAKLSRDETILIHAGGSGIGSAAIKIAKHIGARIITTVGSDQKRERAYALGADHVINYRTERFSREVRKLTDKAGVDVVFEHVGPDTWEESMLAVRVGGRIVTCGSTSGTQTAMNLFQLFNKQIKIFGSFGGTKANIAQSLSLMSQHRVAPVIDSRVALSDYPRGLQRLKDRDVFGKIVINVP